MNEPLTDNDIMPFGKYMGTKLKDVPAEYLDWLNEQDWLEEKYDGVYAYIQDNMDAINQELNFQNIDYGKHDNAGDRL